MSHAAPKPGHGAEGGKEAEELPRGYVSVSRGVRGVIKNFADRAIAATAPKEPADKPGHKKEEAHEKEKPHAKGEADPEKKKTKEEGHEEAGPEKEKDKEVAPKKEEVKAEEKKPEAKADAHPAAHGSEEKGWSTGAKVGLGIAGTLAAATLAAGAAATYIGGKVIEVAGRVGEKVIEVGGDVAKSGPKVLEILGNGITWPFRKTKEIFKGIFGGGSNETVAHAAPAPEGAHAEPAHGGDHPTADAHAGEHKDEHAAAHHRKAA